MNALPGVSNRQYLDGRGRAVLAIAGLWLAVGGTFAFSLLELFGHFALPDWELQIVTGDPSGLAYAFATMGLGAMAVATHLFCIVVFLMWLHRAVHNAHVIGTYAMDVSPAWAVIMWFVPIVTLFLPYRTMRTLYRVSDPEVELGGDIARRRPAAFPIWWLTWIVNSIVGQISFRTAMSDDPGSAETSMWADVISLPFELAAAVCATAIVWSVHVRQQALSVRRTREALPAWPHLGALPQRS